MHILLLEREPYNISLAESPPARLWYIIVHISDHSEVEKMILAGRSVGRVDACSNLMDG